jgi:predicted SAM-dependent methyltransferase
MRPFQLASYFRSTDANARKLHLGCGLQTAAKWLNTDLLPRRKRVVFMNVTRRFHLPDNTFTHIFTEHLIEHVGYRDGKMMLQECFRVLQPGGGNLVVDDME